MRRTLEDVDALLRLGLVEPTRLCELYAQIEPELYRFPAIDPTQFPRGGCCRGHEGLETTSVAARLFRRHGGLRHAIPEHKLAMFRLRNVVLLWVGRKLWSAARPAVQRRLRKRG